MFQPAVKRGPYWEHWGLRSCVTLHSLGFLFSLLSNPPSILIKLRLLSALAKKSYVMKLPQGQRLDGLSHKWVRIFWVRRHKGYAAFFTKCSVPWNNVAAAQFYECWHGTPCSRLPSVIRPLVDICCIPSFRHKHWWFLSQFLPHSLRWWPFVKTVWEGTVFSVVIRQNVPKKPWNVLLLCCSLGGGVLLTEFAPHSSGDSQLCFAQIRSVLDLVVTQGTHRNKSKLCCVSPKKGCRL